jgi:hypothetical protein
MKRARVLSLVPVVISFLACGADPAGDGTLEALGPRPSDATVRTLVCDGVSAGKTKLTEIRVKGLPSYSTEAWVVSRGRTYRLVPAMARADGRTLVDASDGRQWLDSGDDNPVWQSKQAFWSVDPVAGSDDAAGWGDSMAQADAQPLKSFEELWRRLRNATLGPNPLVVHLLSSMSPGTGSTIPPANIGGTPLGTAGIGSTIHVVGKPTLIHAGVLTDVRPFTDNNGNGKYVLQDSTYDWAGGGAVSSRATYGGRLIKKVGAAPVYSMVLAEIAPGEVSVNVPLANDPLLPGHPIAGVSWAKGDAYEVYGLPTVYDMGSTSVQTSYAMVNLGRLGYGTVSVNAVMPMRMSYVCVQENLTFTGTLQAGGVLFMDETQLRHGRWDLFQSGAVGTGDTRVLYLNGLAYIVQFANHGFRQYASSEAFLRISGAQFYDVRYAGGLEGPPALMSCDETGTILIDDSVRGRNNAAYLFSIQTPQSRGIFGATQLRVPVELHPDWVNKVALYFYYSMAEAVEVGWSGLPLYDPERGGAFIGDGLQ